MLWPLLVEYSEPGVPITSYLQQQGNMALFLTLFIVTCVEVLIVKVAQSERELEMMLTPHDPPYHNEYEEDDDDEDYDICRIRASLYEEELIRQKRFLINNPYLTSDGNSDFRETKRAENEFRNGLNGRNLQGKQDEGLQRNPESSTHGADVKTSEIEEPNFDTIKVREVIEKMVETMIGGPLDGTTVGQLSTHTSYLDMFTKYHNFLCRELARLGFALHLSVVRKNVLELDSTDLKQSNLKRLIKRIVSEAMALPNIKKNLCRPKTSNETESEDFRSKSYEDILATAILNKIIDKFQNENYKVKEKAGGRPRPKLRNKKMNRNDDDNDGNLNFDDDWSDTSRSDQLSLTIEEYIEEVTTALEASDNERTDFSDFEPASNRRIPFPESGRIVVDAGADDENSDFEEETTATELVTSTSSWEENWLFQKKRLRSTPNAHHPVPVPMLVPNPSEDFRALVGGVDADDLSDTSDYSDTVLEDLITTEEKPKQLLKHDEAPKYFNSEEENKIKKVEESQNQTKGKFSNDNKDILYSNKNTCSEDVKENGGDKNQEVNEHFEQSLPSLNLSDLSQKDRDSSIEDFPHQYETINSNSNSEGTTQNFSSTDSEDCRKMICILAEKEKEKWMNPAPLTDNPYSLENINKREQRNKNEYFRIGTYTGESIDFPEDLSSNKFPKEETDKLRFSRDYYINGSKHPTGMISPSINRHSDEYEQVSKPSYEVISSLARRCSEKNLKCYSYPDIPHSLASYFTPEEQIANFFPPLQNRHFSEVFKTKNPLNNDPPRSKSLRKYRYGNHTSKSRPRVKEAIFKKPSLQKELSAFEQKSLREDIKHSLLRARGASSNFILNPVFKADVVKKSRETEPLSLSLHERSRNYLKDSKAEFDESELAELSYQRKSGETSRTYKKISRMSHESGYGSDSLDYSSDSLDCWRLTPPKMPEVVESSLVSIVKNRQSKENLGGNKKK